MYLHREFYLYETNGNQEWIFSNIGGMKEFEDMCVDFAKKKFDYKGNQENVLQFLYEKGYSHGLYRGEGE